MKNKTPCFIVLTTSMIFVLAACNMPGFLVSKPPDVLPLPSAVQEPTAEMPINLAGPLPEPGDTLTWVDASLLVYIPPGEFTMGHGGEDNPEHKVFLDGFWIYRTEVTNRMYLRCVVMGECSPPAVDPSISDLEDPAIADHPVVGVRWDQAESYCRFVGGYLPTEAQWEKTARGLDGIIYPWGNAEPNCDLLNFNECLGERSPVIDYPGGASPYDVFDMAGNVFEWVADWYKFDYYVESPQENPIGPKVGNMRSVRGSTFNSRPDQVASALRYFLAPDEYRFDLGFRCVVANAHEFAPACEVLAIVPPDAQGQAGDGPGGSAECVAQAPTIKVVSYCDKGIRGNNISWSPADVDLNYSPSAGISCSQYDADTLACWGSPGGTVDISACKSCPPPVVELGILAKCDPAYILDEFAGLCRYAGDPPAGRDLCTPGFSLRTLTDTVCCEALDGSPHDFPVCPPGGRYDPASRICWFTLPSTGDEKCTTQTVYFDSCERSGGGGDDSGGISCSSYGSRAECEANGCAWYVLGNTATCVGP